MNLFEKFGLSKQLVTAIKELGFTTPTTIQEKTIKPIIQGKDVIGESATGSGKTLAFGCGIIEAILKNFLWLNTGKTFLEQMAPRWQFFC